ncbi:hypothetical protein VNO80_29732 [Phaseolus coccineus]|uniref:Uncharacterized protein n=1 Tax=Phaseolus coccineus TaxID=3886 RepID=A0AAN9QIS8_PHACN
MASISCFLFCGNKIRGGLGSPLKPVWSCFAKRVNMSLCQRVYEAESYLSIRSGNLRGLVLSSVWLGVMLHSLRGSWVQDILMKTRVLVLVIRNFYHSITPTCAAAGEVVVPTGCLCWQWRMEDEGSMILFEATAVQNFNTSAGEAYGAAELCSKRCQTLDKGIGGWKMKEKCFCLKLQKCRSSTTASWNLEERLWWNTWCKGQSCCLGFYGRLCFLKSPKAYTYNWFSAGITSRRSIFNWQCHHRHEMRPPVPEKGSSRDVNNHHD